MYPETLRAGKAMHQDGSTYRILLSTMSPIGNNRAVTVNWGAAGLSEFCA